MKRIVIIAALLSASTANAQEPANPASVKTSVPDQSRFEIVQSPRAARYTFKLDKLNGNVYQLVMSADSTLVWQLLLRQPAGAGDARSGSVNYQLFFGGMAARFTYLINVNTGLTWVLVASKDDEYSFELMP